jgi:hypothetical protein
VTGSEGGGGRLINVDAFPDIVVEGDAVEDLGSLRCEPVGSLAVNRRTCSAFLCAASASAL